MSIVARASYRESSGLVLAGVEGVASDDRSLPDILEGWEG